MVKLRILKLHWILVNLLLSLVYVSHANAMVSLSPKQVMLGEPLILILKGKNIEADFARFDKNLIKENFEIYNVEGGTNFIRLVIYPRKSGQFEFPSMHIGQLQFAGATIEVTPNPDVKIQWQTPHDSAFVRQMQSWKVAVKTSDPAIQVRLLKHPHANDQVMHLFKSQAISGLYATSQAPRKFQMLIGSDQVGKIKVRTPVVEVKNSGNGRPWLFFDDTHTLGVLWLKVKPLPSYLSESIPLGKVTLDQSRLSFWQIKNQQLTWRLTLTGQNISVDTLPDPTTQFSYNHSVEWLLPEATQATSWQAQGMIVKRVINQPLRFTAFGLIRMPDMRITYFDPDTGKLEDQFVTGQWIFSVPRGVYWLMNALFYAFILVLMMLMLWIFRDAWLKWRLITEIKKAQDKNAFWQALLNWTVCQFGQEAQNLSFGQWEQKMRIHYGNATSSFELVRALDKEHFSLDHEELRDLALDWAKSLPIFNWHRLRDRVLAFKLKRV